MLRIPGLPLAYDYDTDRYVPISGHRYIVIPAEFSGTYDAILSYAWRTFRLTGNEFIGSREFVASTGAHVFKLEI